MNIPSSYLEKIRSVYPNISLDHLDFNQDGMVNDVVVVNHDLVCRFAKDDWGKEILAHEAKVLEVVQRYVDLRVPRFEHLEEGFVSYRFIKGEPLSRNTLLKLSANKQAHVISQLARFHQQLHSIANEVLVNAGVSSSGAVRWHGVPAFGDRPKIGYSYTSKFRKLSFLTCGVISKLGYTNFLRLWYLVNLT